MNDGSVQQQRFPAALEPGAFGVDELTLVQRLAVCAGLAGHLKYFDAGNRWDGHTTWQGLFHHDETLVLASIAGFDIARHAPALDSPLDAAGAGAADQIVALAKVVDGWVQDLRRFDSPAALAVLAVAEGLISHQLAPELRTVQAGLRAVPLGRLWVGAAGGPDTDAPSPAPAPDWAALRTGMRSFRTGLRRLAQVAREQLPATLGYATHDPAAGLLLAFVQLFQDVQREQLNRFPERHLDFYYGEILQMRPRPATADQMHLVCRANPRTSGVRVAAGTPFDAGTDLDAKALTYLLDDELIVGPAEVTALRSLRLQCDPLVWPESRLGFVTALDTATLPLPPTGDDAAIDPRLPPHWPLLGGETSHRGPGQPQAAALGLAIASPMLQLSQGERRLRITLRLTYADLTDAQAAALIQQYARAPANGEALLRQLFLRYLELEPTLDDDGLDATARTALVARLASQVQPLLAAPVLTDAVSGHGPVDADTAPRDDRGRYHVLFLAHLALEDAAPELNARRLGRFFSRFLLSEPVWLEPATLRRLRRRIGPFPRDSGLRWRPERRAGRAERDLWRQQWFDICLAEVFDVSLTTADGWLRAANPRVTREPVAAGTRPDTLQVSVTLRSADPAVTAYNAALHAQPPNLPLAGTPAVPVLRLRLRSEARVSPYSLLADALLAEIALEVDVRGMQQLSLTNHLGRLDGSKPFSPFGPLPTTGSYLVFGAPEIACKPLTGMALSLWWRGLPTGAGGFRTHYAGYAGPLDNSSFQVAFSVLRDGGWRPDDDRLQPVPLFGSDAGDEPLRAGHRLRFSGDLLRSERRPTPVVGSAAAFAYGPDARDGFFRMQLTGPDGAFGHQAYAALLARSLTANARLRHPKPLPLAPYTPTLERLSLDYQARSTIVLARPNLGTDLPQEAVFSLQPFGHVRLHPQVGGARPWLLPRFDDIGHLYIGITASHAPQRLNLLFQLRADTAMPRQVPPPPLRWHALAGGRWVPLAPSQVLADSTHGYLHSGIVSLDLPDGMGTEHELMPGGRYWLRLSGRGDLAALAQLQAVRAQAQSATLADAVHHRRTPGLLPAGSVKAVPAGAAGLQAVQQIGPSFGRRPPETPRAMRTRVGERLSHKNRCTTPHDYERVVLEAFPEVFRCKCFAGLSTGPQRAQPGSVLLVVIPAVDETGPLAGARTPRVDADQLQRIAQHVRQRASPFVQLEVCNAVYERIQVRCAVRLAPGRAAGPALARLNEAAIECLSPWSDNGRGVHFGWSLRPVDLATRLHGLEGVASLSRLSLLQVTPEGERLYHLSDSVEADQVLRARLPWSLAVPMAQHLIELDDTPQDVAPRASGIDMLELGNTFVVDGPAPTASPGRRHG